MIKIYIYNGSQMLGKWGVGVGFTAMNIFLKGVDAFVTGTVCLRALKNFWSLL